MRARTVGVGMRLVGMCSVVMFLAAICPLTSRANELSASSSATATVEPHAVSSSNMTCGTASPAALESQVYTISPGPNTLREIQERILDAVPGDVIQLEAGRYQLPRQIDVAVAGITIRGRGPTETVLSFKGQIDGGQGI